MDWSLVLASQGIEHSIDYREDLGWSLSLAAADRDRALAAIHQFRLDNRRWVWRKTIPHSGLVFDWAASGWVLLTIAFYWMSLEPSRFRTLGSLDGAAVTHGEWWRLFTATLLHANLTHLGTNALFGFLLLGLAMGRFGSGLGLLSAFLAGVLGNLASWLAHTQPFQGLGASGVVMGGLGLLTTQSFGVLRKNPFRFKIVLGSVAGGVMLFVLLGAAPESDFVAHAGGFLAGMGSGLLLGFLPPRRTLMEFIAGAVFAGLVLTTWLLALRSAR